MITLSTIRFAVSFLKKKGINAPEVGVILGTGLSKLIDEVNVIKVLDYSEIPHFPLSTVETHSGKLIYGTLKDKKVILMQGRFHLYEGYSMQQITFPIRVMKLLGVKNLFISNVSGAINPKFKRGSLMLIEDHINLLCTNPLIGTNIDELGPRFPDMSEPYSHKLNDKIEKIAKKKNILLNRGVYAAMTGPSLETRAEYRFLKIIGADAVGMSTIPEVIVANHMGLPCVAVAVLTDECDPDNLKPLSLEEIIKEAEKAEPQLVKLFVGLIEEL